ncbi:MAG: hypothetical protein IPM46_08720 [Flavobacteriales bacterium]|nr:hypothetical protein [Flavobacteriales bacterium]
MMNRITLFSLSTALLSCGAPQPTNEQTTAPVVADTSAKAVTDGHQVIHTQDGGRMEGFLRDGKRDGPWVAYYASGGVRSRTTYTEGVEEGPMEVFHENGMTYYFGQYHQGLTIGEWIFFDPQGKEVKRVVYDSTGVAVK